MILFLRVILHTLQRIDGRVQEKKGDKLVGKCNNQDNIDGFKQD